MARPIEIATLGHAPVMGQSTSAGQLRYNFEHNQPIMRQAARKIGLTPEQFEKVRTAIDVPKPNWVTVPRHLDVMTWGADGVVHTLRDVIIPPNQKGIEVDIPSNGQMVVVYLPAKCGNLSLVRKPLPYIAHVHNFPVPHPRPPTAYSPPPAPTPTPVVYVAPTPEPSPIVAAVLPPVAAAHHAFSLLPLAALIPFLFTGGGGSSLVNPSTPDSGGTVVGSPPCP